MFVFILTKASLESIPKKLWNHPAVQKWAKVRRKHPSKMILDQTLHFSAIRQLEDYQNRGRVDILHRALLTILDSKLNKKGYIKAIVIHTTQDKYYIVNPEARLPRHYFRFLGIMEDLLQKGKIETPEGKTLIGQANSIEDVTKKHNIAYTICLETKGKHKRIAEVIPKQPQGNIGIIVGALPHGDIPQKFLETANEIISIGTEPLTTSYVLCRTIIELEQILGI
mgnify:CR=1 FL=1